MNRNVETAVKNSVWRSISENVTRERLSELASVVREAFGRLAVGGGRDGINTTDGGDANINKPIYTGPKNQVQWNGDVYTHPQDRYLADPEFMNELDMLDMRFRRHTQTRQARQHTETRQARQETVVKELDAEESKTPETMTRTDIQRNGKFARLRKLATDLKKRVFKTRRERSAPLLEKD